MCSQASRPATDSDPKCASVIATLDELKMQDTLVLDVHHLTPIADTMIIATGRSNRHVKSAAERLAELMKHDYEPCLSVEGLEQADWVLLDLNGIIVHIMQQKARDYYQLEKLWGLSDTPATRDDKGAL